ncbi:hypothetical protein Asp14428_34360 [Actinoplanes sp. NBRC 14428]|nr:hypothetical protein Asp14428_34360 [Actinoplanes sp. NBRC 14428]
MTSIDGWVESPSEVRVLYFFLSYARGDDDVYVQEFFNDLCDEVRALEGLDPATEVGFLDNRNIQPGDTWPDTLVDALSRCQAFLALCSPAYFLSEPCGREWAIFQERIRQHQLRTGNTGSTLIPLRWLPSRTMSPAAEAIQFLPGPRYEDRPQDAYRERGIRQLLRIRRNRDDYLEFVTTVAELVVEATWRDPMPTAAERLPFEEVPSAFHPQPRLSDIASTLNNERLPDVATLDVLPVSDKVYFVVSAPTADEAADERVGREDRQYYGPTARSWSPYKPGTHEPLADYAARIAAERGLGAEITEVDDLERCIDRARRKNQVVVLLVDPWSLRVDHVQEMLARYDRRENYPAAVMLPWSTDDLETSRKTPELIAAMRQTFPRNMRRPHATTFRSSVLTIDSFRSDLQAVLEVSRNRQLEVSSRARRPTLSGP